MFYFVKTPWYVRKIYHSYTWRVRTNEKELYLTFDDGPHPEITPFVLAQLKQFNALATFFCIGKNVQAHRSIYEMIISHGHAVGNHTQTHLNGWKVSDNDYMSDIKEAASVIDSSYFRPPYGRIRNSQATSIREAMNREDAKVMMWDILSGDFDQTISSEKCFENVKRSRRGSIIVFHDSEKAFSHLSYALPKCLDYFAQKGYSFRKL